MPGASGNHEDVEVEESGERGAADNRASEHQVHHPGTDDRYAARDGRADTETPVSVLIEAQNLPGERHPERHEQQEHAQNPRQLPRILVRAEQEDLHHVNQHDRDHEVGAPAV